MSKMPNFRVKSVKIYTGQKKFTRVYPWDPWQIWGMHKIPKSSYNDNNSVWIGREQLNLGPNVINTASGAHMQWGNRCQIQNKNIHQFQIQNTKIHRCKIQKHNNAIRQPLPSMTCNYYIPMPNTRYKLANHWQIQNTVYTQYSLLSH